MDFEISLTREMRVRAFEGVLRLVDGYRDGMRVDEEVAISWVTAVMRDFLIDSLHGLSEPADAVNQLAAAIEALAHYAAAMQVVVETVTGPEDAAAIVEIARNRFRQVFRGESDQ